MIPMYLSPLASHLWQSTLFAAVVLLLAFALRRNHAQARYWLWLTASIKFLIPFSLLVSAGRQVEWRDAPAVVAPLTVAVDQISQPFAPAWLGTTSTVEPAQSADHIMAMLLVAWFCGFAIVICAWFQRWRRIQRALQAAYPLSIDAPVPVMSSPTVIEPGVFGIFKPVLLLPQGIFNRLTAEQLNAILAHEMCHIRRRDNLAAALHMLVEAIFWFHPPVWWIGSRLIDERERACDEEVLRSGNEPQVYAEGILNVCKFYLESPLPCASGVTGSDLKKRIEAIMTNRIAHRLTAARKVLLASAAIASLAGPLVFGIIHAQAQTTSQDTLKFEVASVKPADPDAQGTRIQLAPGGGMNMVNASVKQLITFAYDVRESQLVGGPNWLDSQRYDIIAKPPPSEGPTDPRQMTNDQRTILQQQMRERVRNLLAERFQLTIHRETREIPIYALILAKNGSKIQPSKEQQGPRHGMQLRRGQMNAEGASLQMFANALSNIIGRPVIDRTGLTGNFDFKLEWTPESGALTPGAPGERTDSSSQVDLSGPTIFTAVQDQLGLKLESQKGPVEMIVIDRLEKASAN
ncbi:MAG TPA: M56 and DUF3738 domain-containing protein [Bryobacteraceae bacterium]|nr:M56 and DUF3738 domain-containing protein [Bryobacteraceae bacterium]